MNRIKPDGPNLEPTECPHCNQKIDSSSGLQANVQPHPEDVSICMYCGEPSKFDEQLQMVKLEGSEIAEVMADPAVQQAMIQIKAMKAASNHDRRKAYADQLDKMKDAVIAWRKEHSDPELSIQYNFQKGTCVIAALQDAIDHKFISVNDDALKMFKELGWLDDVKAMPTVLMVRAVLEHAFRKE